MNIQSKKCDFCGNVFYKKPSHSQIAWDTTAKFCSKKCYWNSKVEWFTCEWCGEKYRRKSHTPKKQKFCSRKCVAEYQSKSRAHPRKPCKVCGKPVNFASSKFCSQECFKQWYRGDNVYNYLGPDGPWISERAFYGSSFWFKQCQKVRRRDKVCQRCGKTKAENGKALDVHHIIPRRISHDDSTSNLQALCTSCHPVVEAEARELYD